MRMNKYVNLIINKNKWVFFKHNNCVFGASNVDVRSLTMLRNQNIRIYSRFSGFPCNHFIYNNNKLVLNITKRCYSNSRIL